MKSVISSVFSLISSFNNLSLVFLVSVTKGWPVLSVFSEGQVFDLMTPPPPLFSISLVFKSYLYYILTSAGFMFNLLIFLQLLF